MGLKVNLHADWKSIIRKAWSIRLMLLAAVLSGAEVALPYLVDKFPPGVFAAISAVVSAGAMLARVMLQKDMA